MNTTKKSLWGLVLVAIVILVLATIAPGAWATPNQSPLRDTIPPPSSISGYVCNNVNVIPDCQFPPDTPRVNELVTLDPGGTQTTLTDTTGWYSFGPLVVGSTHVVEALGVRRTVVVPADPGARQDFWPGMPPEIVPVGGYAQLANRFELLAPWVGLAALMGVVVAAVVVRLRRQE